MKNIPKSIQGLPFDFNIALYKRLKDYNGALWYREILWRYRLFKQLNKNREGVLKHFATYREHLGTFEEFIFGSPLKAETTFGIGAISNSFLTSLDSAVFFFENKQYKIFDDSYSRVKSQLYKTQPKDASIRFYTMREALSLYDRHADLFSDEYDYNHEQGAAQKVLNQPIHEVEKASLLETECILKVDLSRKNDVLFGDFKTFIEEHRKQVKSKFLGDERSLKMELGNNKYAKWCDDKIIPFIDILLWKMYSDINLSSSQIINALESRTDFRTIEKEASAILTAQAIRTIKMQI